MSRAADRGRVRPGQLLRGPRGGGMISATPPAGWGGEQESGLPTSAHGARQGTKGPTAAAAAAVPPCPAARDPCLGPLGSKRPCGEAKQAMKRAEPKRTHRGTRGDALGQRALREPKRARRDHAARRAERAFLEL